MGFEEPKNGEMKEDNNSDAVESRETKKQREMARVREDSMTLTQMYLEGTKSYIDKEIVSAPNTWNENDGVIVWLDENGRKYATPSSDRTREIMSEHLKKNEGIGVPHLNVGDVWGSEPEKNSSYNEWQALRRRVSNVQ